MAVSKISIQGLNNKQRALMDVMWAMDDIEKVNAFVKTLPTRDAQDCMSLIEIAIQESYEQTGGLDEYQAAAQAVIAGHRLS